VVHLQRVPLAGGELLDIGRAECPLVGSATNVAGLGFKGQFGDHRAQGADAVPERSLPRSNTRAGGPPRRRWSGGWRDRVGRSYLRPFRAAAGPPRAPVRPPKVRHIAGWILRRFTDLNPDEQTKLRDIRSRCRHLDALTAHVAAFGDMLTGRHGHRLDAWIAAVEADDLPELHSYANGLKRDYNAVRNGLTLTHSSGAVEGQVNRIKMIKRQMSGRAKLDLLRKRVLLAT
jgi:hypothetical protein